MQVFVCQNMKGIVKFDNILIGKSVCHLFANIVLIINLF